MRIIMYKLLINIISYSKGFMQILVIQNHRKFHFTLGGKSEFRLWKQYIVSSVAASLTFIEENGHSMNNRMKTRRKYSCQGKIYRNNGGHVLSKRLKNTQYLLPNEIINELKLLHWKIPWILTQCF